MDKVLLFVHLSKKYNYTRDIYIYTSNIILINYSYKCNNKRIRTGVDIHYHNLFISY